MTSFNKVSSNFKQGPIQIARSGSTWILILCLVAGSLGTACGGTGDNMADDNSFTSNAFSKSHPLPYEGDMPSLSGAKEWLNSPPLSTTNLRGKVVLVQFWTYTCINWLRTEPYIRAWAEKYKDKGLVVIGVHTPEFEFEKNVDNIRREAKAMSIDYPIAVDSDHRIWRAFDNRYWPALYFVDAGGKIRHHQFGEGDYEKSERVIQKLLSEAGNENVNLGFVRTEGKGVEVAADWDNLRSPENYLGYARTANFASPEGVDRNRNAKYSFPIKLTLNQWALEGDWKITESTARSENANGRLTIRFHARDLHLVMGSVKGVALPIRFRVLIDGHPPGSSHGIDTNDQGYGTISAPRMYQMVRQSGPITDSSFEIQFLDPNINIYAVTFG